MMEMIPVRRLLARLRILRLPLVGISGIVPVNPLPARWKVLRLGIVKRHRGILPWKDCLLLLHDDPTPTPSRIRLLILEEHTLVGRVPVMQLLDKTNVFSPGKLNKASDSVPVNLIPAMMTVVNDFEVLTLKRDTILPPSLLLFDKLMMLRFRTNIRYDGAVPLRLLSLRSKYCNIVSCMSRDGMVPDRLLLAR